MSSTPPRSTVSPLVVGVPVSGIGGLSVGWCRLTDVAV
jgi:hypothetical protein